MGLLAFAGTTKQQVAGMSAAICGADLNKKNPGYRFAHPGYTLHELKHHPNH
jgi:hypothetical protein